MSMSVEAIAASGAQVGRALTRQFIGRVAPAWRTSESAPSSADFGPYDVDDTHSGTLGVPIAPGPLPAGRVRLVYRLDANAFQGELRLQLVVDHLLPA